MAKVFFTPISSYDETARISAASGALLEKVVEEGNIALYNKMPMKVHFGERGNTTYIHPKNMDGLIDTLQKMGSEPVFMETNVLYRGDRINRDTHIALAKEHGFTRLPIVIADGERGEEYVEVEIDGERFQRCKIGREVTRHPQMVVVTHFKGHMLAGYGGALKQLSMGCAARGGKLDMHANAKPMTNPLRLGGCKECTICVNECPVDAIELGMRVKVNKERCVGCAVCIAVCPQGVFKINWLGAMAKTFSEKMAEYAVAAAKGKTNIYVSYAFNITRNCDCMGKKQKPIAPDLGVFASTDPVAIDQACLDVLEKKLGKKKFGGRHALEHAEKLGLGRREYELVEG